MIYGTGMATHAWASFSDDYIRLLNLRAHVREIPPAPISEAVLQCVWYDQLFATQELRTDEGCPVRVLSPGWWNHGEGPDFKGAQIEFNGTLHSGDVEIHFTRHAWHQHGHNADPRYDNVILEVVLDPASGPARTITSSGRAVATLCLGAFLEDTLEALAERLLVDDYPYRALNVLGQCSSVVQAQGPAGMLRLISLAGEWRMLSKARVLAERVKRVGADQSIYEAFMAACGYSRFKQAFTTIARQLPYERVRQLAQQNGLLLEAALLQVAGLLNAERGTRNAECSHLERLRALREQHLAGLKSLPLEWPRVGVRPVNYPERRVAGAARFLARTAKDGLVESLDAIWRQDMKPIQRRRAFQNLFPAPMGFWASHCTWTGKPMAKPASPLGAGRAHSIIGNVFVPAALAAARDLRDRAFEERVLEFFSSLPKEPENQILKAMLPRLLGPDTKPKETFRLQQGLQQIHQDWCEPNPSCHNCRILGFLQP